jgi:predicted nuclease with TOPRIM domain
MSKQPDALRLAEDMLNCSFGRTVTVQNAAEELRRLHAKNADLEEAVRLLLTVVSERDRLEAQRDELLEALKTLDANPDMLSAWLQARAAIAKAQQ